MGSELKMSELESVGGEEASSSSSSASSGGGKAMTMVLSARFSSSIFQIINLVKISLVYQLSLHLFIVLSIII